MQIKLDQHEVVEAIEEFVKNKYGLSKSLYSDWDYPCFTYQKLQRHFKKHRNGYPMKDDNGNRVFDPDKKPYYTTNHLNFDDTFELSFMLGEGNDD